MDKEEAKLITNNDELWTMFSERLVDVKEILVGNGENIDIDVSRNLLYNALKVIIGDLYINKKQYEELSNNIELKNKDDFLNFVLKSLGNEIPPIEQKEENEKYINKFREIIWVYIKKYEKLLLLLLLKINDETDSSALSDVETNLMVSCLIVVFIECVLRNREFQILEWEN